MRLNLLKLPLQGRQIIEASAGTGKTWTLAALYVRLVLGHGRPENQGLKPSQILVMTFTEAATAELRERIRHRLHEAALWFDARAAQRHTDEEPFLEELAQAYTPAQWSHCAALLHLAAQSMDEAAIFTIHGWSRRMLSSFALHSRDLFEQHHLDNPSQLLHPLVNDHWRRWFYPLPVAAQQQVHELLGGDPQALLPELKTRWQAMDRAPQTTPMPTPPAPAHVLALHQAWADQHKDLIEKARQAWRDDIADILRQAQADKKIKSTRADFFGQWVQALQAWATQGSDIKPETLARFSISTLLEKGWSQASDHALFAHIETLCQHAEQRPPSKEALLNHAAFEVRQQYTQTKQQLSVFDFQDLLQRLHTALHADEGQMATAIRAQYPVAMVDEFQDTDPWQYQSLDCIYNSKVVTTHHALIMIGDPKQAIYSFRGADLRTYLQGRQAALNLDPHALHSLDSNFRSAPALVRAVNHVFGRAHQPFYSELGDINFIDVHSRSNALPLTDVNGQAQHPFTVWYLPSPTDTDKPHWPAAQHLQQMADGFASQMVHLLQAHADIQPGDMAVLVRTHVQAKAVQKALRQRGLPSVFMSDQANVYQSEEAQDLWRVLRAISAPRQTSWLRSAVASRVWGLSMAQLQTHLQDESQTNALAESCHRWLQQWQQQGVLPMMHSWLHEQGIAKRLLQEPQGERRLTNVLHLGELLQDASQGLQGPAALLQHLADNMQRSSDSPEAQKMRLETDDQCVQIVTFHKSKGLEYPLVFVPFLGSFKAAGSKDDDASDNSESSTDEDMRLLYVALTRAKRGLWLGLAHTASSMSGKGDELRLSAVSRLLQRQTPQDLLERLQATWGLCEDIAISPLPLPTLQRYLAPTSQALPQAALVSQRGAYKRWWTASFSSLTRGLEAGTPHEEAFSDAQTDAQLDDEVVVDEASAWQTFPAGARYGSLLHDLLEWQAQQAWPLTQNPNSAWHNTAWQQLLQRKADWLQLSEQHQALLTPWVQAIMGAELPLSPPLCLHHLQSQQHWAEMEFSLPAGQVASGALDTLIQQHILQGQARPALLPQLMQGMLTGFMDLVLVHDGRYWVMDYKSNKLANYEANSLQQAVLDKRYDVQYVLYILALHRLLKTRLPDYNYETHMGGAVYVFLRGIDSPSRGVHALRPPFALIHQLDQLFAQEVTP